MIKKVLIILFFISLAFNSSYSQRKKLDSLKLDSIPEFELEDPSMFETNIFQRGWFPNYTNFKKFIGMSNSSIFLHESASNIRSKYFYDIGAGFKSGLPIGDEDRMKIVKDPKTGEKEDEYPEKDAGDLAIAFGVFVPSTPLFFQVNAIYSQVKSRLFYLDKSKHYLDYYGNLCAIEELNVLYLNQHFIGLNPHIKLSLWGANMGFKNYNIGSVYYLNLGLDLSYSVQSRFTQYSQIVSDKNNIRYNNGKDTLNVIDNKYLENINPFRSVGHIGFGIGTTILMMKFDFEIFYKRQLNNVIKDGDWKNHGWGIRGDLMFSF